MTTRATITTHARTHAWRSLSLTRTTAYRYRSTGAHRVRGISTGVVRPCAAFFMIERRVEP